MPAPTSPALRPIEEVAEKLGISPELLIPYGHTKAKIRCEVLDRAAKAGRLILVSATTPTDAGEGKTTTSIGLAQGLAKIGKRAAVALREPSLGPIFGLKGGATGGGLSRVEPWQEINMHFTGDFHAISTANNFLAALIDNHLHHGNELGIDPRRVSWRRAIDLNERALRQTIIGLGGASQGVPRETGFDITPASEIMAVLCLSKDREDLRARLGRIIIGLGHDKRPITAADLKAVGALLAILNDAIHPNLVQTTEGVPAFIHGGPFANIAHGCNSILATRMALAHADYAVTEAGFAFDLGGEKFLDIKCRIAGLDPAAIVLVTTVRALKLHGGAGAKNLAAPDPAAVERGFDNLRAHVDGVRLFGRDPIIAINRFPTDSEDELRTVEDLCRSLGVAAARSEIYARGGDGGRELAALVAESADAAKAPYTPLYALEASLEDKVKTVATKLYGAGTVTWTHEAERARKQIEKLGHGHLPICIAKTQKSLSDDPTLLGRPRDFELKVRDMMLSAGAGFVIAVVGEILRMPGLPKNPQSEHVDVIDGTIVGLA